MTWLIAKHLFTFFSFFLSKEEAIDRRTYIPPDNYDTEAMKQFRSYLEETGVEGTFKNMVKLLLNRPTLPYNPYPGFVLRFRQYAEKLVSQRLVVLCWNLTRCEHYYAEYTGSLI